MYNHDNRGNILTVRKPGVMFRQYVYNKEIYQIQARFSILYKKPKK